MRLAIVSFALVLSTCANAQYYTVDLHPGGPSDQSYGYGIAPSMQAGSVYLSASGEQHAAVWSDTAGSFVDLNPTGSIFSTASATDGSFQAGYFYFGNQPRAAVWSGTAGSMVDLHPASFDATYATAAYGGQQGGYGAGTPSTPFAQALLWSGTAASVVNLNPVGMTGSIVYGMGSGMQVGFAFGGDFVNRAAMWSGSAASYVDLHPMSGFLSSQATATDGLQQGGTGRTTSNQNHALLWSGSSASVIDLHPASGFSQTFINGVSNGKQVGAGSDMTGYSHALVWSGTAASMIDLNQFMPPGYYAAYATSIDSSGRVFGVGYSASGQPHAMVWIPGSPPPPPPSYSFVGFFKPLNDPGNRESVFLKGSVVPVTFRLVDNQGAGVTGETATISIERVGSSRKPINEWFFFLIPDNGVSFRDVGHGYYRFNLRTWNLASNSRYRLTATYGTGSHSVEFSVR